MWKKDEDEIGGTAATPKSTATSNAAPISGTTTGRTAVIGSAITIQGEVSGDEDLLIEGRVEGSVDLGEHAVTIGTDGSVTARITARSVTVEGRVEGDIEGRDRVVLRASSDVQGDITAPRVVLEDGARFRGGVDMGAADRSPSKPAGTKPDSSTGGSPSSSSSSASSTSATSSSSASSSNGKKSEESSDGSSSSKREIAGAGKGGSN